MNLANLFRILLLLAALLASGGSAQEFAPDYAGSARSSFESHHRRQIIHESAISGIPPEEIMGLRVTDASTERWSEYGKRFTNLAFVHIEMGADHICNKVYDSLSEFPRLKYLFVLAPNLVSIDPNVARLAHALSLQSLCARTDRLTNIDEGIYRLTGLAELGLTAKELRLPDGISQLTNLVNLRFTAARPMLVKHLPADLDVSSVRGLEMEGADGLKDALPSLPNGIVYFRAVRCGLREVPRAWLTHGTFHTILLNNNLLEEMPDDFSWMSELEFLDFSYNRLRTIPALRLATSGKLKDIRISGNALEWIDHVNRELVERHYLIGDDDLTPRLK